MSQWKHFEQRVYNESNLLGIFVSRIPTGCRIIRPGKPPKVQLVKTDFDFCAGLNGQALFFDAKATDKGTFNFKSYVEAPKKVHQYTRMCQAHDMGNLAGYLIWFYDKRMITWAPIQLVRAMLREGGKGINPDTPGCRSQEDWKKLDLVELCIPDPIFAHVSEQTPNTSEQARTNSEQK